jgi:hypothetical protein
MERATFPPGSLPADTVPHGGRLRSYPFIYFPCTCGTILVRGRSANRCVREWVKRQAEAAHMSDSRIFRGTEPAHAREVGVAGRTRSAGGSNGDPTMAGVRGLTAKALVLTQIARLSRLRLGERARFVLLFHGVAKARIECLPRETQSDLTVTEFSQLLGWLRDRFAFLTPEETLCSSRP